MNKDFDGVLTKKLSVVEFNKRYGHLRPGTYDITKLPYSKDSKYFNEDQEKNVIKMNFDDKEKNIVSVEKKINKFLNDFEVSISAKKLLKFIQETIIFRERFKFEFTKNLSLALEYLAEAGGELGFDREMLSHLSIESLAGISKYSGNKDIVDFWNSQITGKKKNDEVYQYIALPALVFSDSDFDIIQSFTIRPNFITKLQVRGKLINLDAINIDNYNIVCDRIVLLEKADPGYDWIFSRGIKGLITRFGGAASHMAIRSAEFGIPAAIGCGEIIFKDIMGKQLIELDCLNKKIIKIR